MKRERLSWVTTSSGLSSRPLTPSPDVFLPCHPEGVRRTSEVRASGTGARSYIERRVPSPSWAPVHPHEQVGIPPPWGELRAVAEALVTSEQRLRSVTCSLQGISPAVKKRLHPREKPPSAFSRPWSGPSVLFSVRHWSGLIPFYVTTGRSSEV